MQRIKIGEVFRSNSPYSDIGVKFEGGETRLLDITYRHHYRDGLHILVRFDDQDQKDQKQFAYPVDLDEIAEKLFRHA